MILREWLVEGLDNMMLKAAIKSGVFEEDLQSDHDKYYNNVPIDTYLKLVQQDPTCEVTSLKDNKGKYTKWILDKYTKGVITDADLADDRIRQVLKVFNERKKSLDINQDINSYASVEDIQDKISNASPSERSRKQESSKKEKAAKKINLNDYVEKEDRDWILYRVTDQLILIRLGRNAQNKAYWCIAQTEGDTDYYGYYLKQFGDGFAWILVNKDDPYQKYCICPGTGEFFGIDNKPMYDGELHSIYDSLSPSLREYMERYVGKPIEFGVADRDVRYDDILSWSVQDVAALDYLDRKSALFFYFRDHPETVVISFLMDIIIKNAPASRFLGDMQMVTDLLYDTIPSEREAEYAQKLSSSLYFTKLYFAQYSPREKLDKIRDFLVNKVMQQCEQLQRNFGEFYEDAGEVVFPKVDMEEVLRATPESEEDDNSPNLHYVISEIISHQETTDEAVGELVDSCTDVLYKRLAANIDLMQDNPYTS